MTGGEFDERLAERAGHAGLILPPDILRPLETYYRLLATWNARINLTAVDLKNLPAAAVDRLFIEPLKAATFAPREASVIDIGSGGGSPAIPFALAAHAARLVMVEARTRKSIFLREAARELSLPFAEVVTARAEALTDDSELRNAFDVLTIRAVRAEAELERQLGCFLRPGGSLYFFQPAKSGLLKEAGSIVVPLTPAGELRILKPS